MFDVFLTLHRVVLRLRQQSTDVADNPGVRSIRGLDGGCWVNAQSIVVGCWESERESDME